jgi:hypothetical protein
MTLDGFAAGTYTGVGLPAEANVRLCVIADAVLLVLLVLLAGCSEHAGSPLSPTPAQRLQGTYTLTAETSRSCLFRKAWEFRADITQSGRDLKVKLWKTDGSHLCLYIQPSGSEKYPACQTSFHGQDNQDGVLFLPDSENILFATPAFTFGVGEEAMGAGHATGQYLDGRIEARYDGYVVLPDVKMCYASDHLLTFVRR